MQDTATDLTAQFDAFRHGSGLDTHAAAAAFAGVRNRLAGTHVLLVPPFLSDMALFDTGNYKLVGFFPELEKWLKAEGVSVARAPLGTQTAIEENGARLLGMVRASTKPVFLIGHSKGGLDSLSCMLQAEDEDLDHVAGFLTFQSPFGGSPAADIGDETVLRRGLDPLLTRWGGSYQSLKDLCTSTRKEYLAQHDVAIRHVLDRVPQLSVATYRTAPWYKPGWLTTYLLSKGAKRTDTLVTVESAALPHGRFIAVPGIEHGAVTIRKEKIGGRYDRTAFHQIMMALLFGE
jgi:hypothetical protein